MFRQRLFIWGFAMTLVFSAGFFSVFPVHALTLIDDTASTEDLVYNDSNSRIVWISATEGFVFYADTDGSDLTGTDIIMASTTDGGATWGNFTNVDSVNTTDAFKVTVWYDRWTPGDTTGNLIHIATFDSGVDDTYYIQYNTVTNQFSAAAVTGTESAAASGRNVAPITKAENGALYTALADSLDGWVHTCAATCTNGANWSALTRPWAANGDDHLILLPVQGTNNVMLLHWDISDDDIESFIYSATSSSWWGPDIGITQGDPANTTYDSSLMGATINRSTGEIYLAYVADADEYTVEDHDIDIWEFNNTTFTWSQKTASALVNMSGGLAGVKIAVDESTGNLYLAYVRRTTISDALTENVYWRVSTDNGETWSAEIGPITPEDDRIYGLSLNLMSASKIGAIWKFADPNASGYDLDGVYYELLDPADIPTAQQGTGRIIRLNGNLRLLGNVRLGG